MNKLIIYQIFFRLFSAKGKNNKYGSIEENGCTKFSDISSVVLKELKKTGYSHIWFTGLIEHATATDYSKFGIMPSHPEVVKGRAGSPYAIRDYYDICPDFATDANNRMEEFEAMLKRTHKEGLKAIIDFVPNHVARDYKSDVIDKNDLGDGDDTSIHFSPNNNFYYFPNEQFVIPEGISYPYLDMNTYIEFPAKATGNDAFTPRPSINDWFETVKLNYGIDYLNGKRTYFKDIPDTWKKMLSILQYWSSKGVDGFRCDMAEMVPVEFWEWAIAKIKEDFPDIVFIAEVYNPQEYRNYIFRGGFDYLYDKVGLYDTLKLNMTDSGTTEWITYRWQELEGINDKMLRFLENHDEQRIASRFFATDPWRAIPALVASATMHNGPLMIYFGQEVGEKGEDEEGFSGLDGRTTIFDYWSLSEYQKLYNDGKFDGGNLSNSQRRLFDTYKKIIKVTRSHKVFHTGKFYDLMWVNKTDNVNFHKIYAYIRYSEEERILIVLNFNFYNTETLKLKIPSDAFDLMGIYPQKKIRAKDLITCEQVSLPNYTAMTEEGINLSIDLGGALMIKF